MEQNINKAVHSIILQHLNSSHITMDATCGNGHDTLFLAKHSKTVYAFDIQDQAIQTTKQTIQDAGYDNVHYIQDSHEFIQNHVSSPVHLVMYNLGYLPHGDHAITTTSTTTVTSLKQAIQILEIGGLITITIYIGHEGGFDEAMAVESFVKTLNKHNYTVVKYEHINRDKAPYAILIQKIR